MTEVSEKHIRMWKEGMADPTRKRGIKNQIVEELEGMGVNPAGVKEYLKTLRGKAKSPDSAKESATIGEIVPILKNYFRYKSRKIDLDMLRNIKFKSVHIEVIPAAYKATGLGDMLTTAFKRYRAEGALNEVEKSNLTMLKKAFNRGEELRAGPQKTTKPTRRKFTIKSIMGKPKLSDLDQRKKIYAYWADLQEEWMDSNKLMKSINDFIKAASKEDLGKEFEDAVNRLADLKETNIDYIMPVKSMPLVIVPAEERALELIRQYLIARGLAEIKHDVGSTHQRGGDEQLDVQSRKEGAKIAEGGEFGWGAGREGSIAQDTGLTLEEEVSEGLAFGGQEYHGEDMADPYTVSQKDIEESEKSFEDIDAMLNDIQSKELMVDPLFNYYFQENDYFIPIDKGELKKIKREIRSYALEFTNPKQLEDYEDWIESLVENVAHYDDLEYPLPITPTFNEDGKITEKDAEVPVKWTSTWRDSSKNVAEFIDAVANVVEQKRTQFATTTGPYPKDPTNIKLPQERRHKESDAKTTAWYVQSGLFPRIDIAGIKGTRFEIEGGSSLDKKLNTMLKAINAYYIKPLESNRFWEEEKPRWVSDRAASESAIESIKLYVKQDYGEIGEQYLRYGTASIEGSTIIAITNFFQEISGRTVEITGRTFSKASAAVKAMTDMFGKSSKQRNLEWVGAVLYNMINEGNDEAKELKWEGKALVEWWEDFEDKMENITVYPMFIFDRWLSKHQEEINSDHTIASKVRELVKLLNKLNDNDPIEKALLQAHDMVRLMKGLPVFFGRYYLNDPDQLDDVITKMETKHKVDLAASEVYDIVKTVDAIKNIAQNHGLTEELVYELKANFR